MIRRVVVALALLAAVVSGSADAQAMRWNDRGSAVDTLDETPRVNIWIEGARLFTYGEPVRVWFNVSQDAYVIVARVDANGHLTLLYPGSRTRSTAVEGGRDLPVRGRRGSASFYATDRQGGGFVFAMASFDPFDLSRLGIRDFDRYVTGTYVGRPSHLYVGDPHRVISRFASLVLFGDNTPFDYAVDYYQVDSPYFVTSSGFSNFCNGYYGQYRRGLQERWDDEFYYGAGGGSLYDCGSLGQCFASGFSPLGWSSLYGMFSFYNPLCLFGRSGGVQVVNNPPIPPLVPGFTDSTKAGGWFPDSSTRPPVGGTIPDEELGKRRGDLGEGIRRSSTVSEGPRRPIRVDDGPDPTERSYSIPVRALRNSPVTIGDRRGEGSGPRPDRISAGSNEGITWVRPPREVVEGPRTPYGTGALPRSARSGSGRDDGVVRGGRTTFVTEGRSPVRTEPPRYERPTRYEPPSRNDGPRFDAPMPTTRGDFGSPRSDASPRAPAPRVDAPAAAPSPARSEPVRATPPHSTEVKAASEKKPDKQ